MKSGAASGSSNDLYFFAVPDGSSLALTGSLTANTNNETIDWGSVSGAQMIAVHRIRRGDSRHHAGH